MAGLRVAATVLALVGLSSCAGFQAAQLYGSGTEALDRGEAELAIRDLERAAELAPEASEVQNHLGLAYDAAGRQGEARAAYQRAVDLDCENQAAQANLAGAEARSARGFRP